MNVAVVLILSAFAADAQPSDYRWPLDLPRVLTSSFAEYRAGRYHMGIDLRTGAIGKDVYAMSDGYVSRIRCSPYGYGKAIYLQLADGNSVVYAHLDDFSPELRAFVQRAQHDRKRYTVDLYPDPGLFKVSKGDKIGKSGQTGIGVPHLHYEIRDRAGVPINPKRLGVDWPDSTSPVFRKLLAIPLDPMSRINGDLLPVVLPIRSAGTGKYRVDPIRVSGPVAFGVDVVDPANGGGTRLGVHTITTRHAEAEIFRLVHDRVGYGNDRDGVVAYHPFYLKEGHFLLQWRWPDNDSDLYTTATGNGVVDIQADEGSVTMVATDFHGNDAELNIPMRRDDSGIQDVMAAPGEASAKKGSIEFEVGGQWIVASARFPGNESAPPQIDVSRKASGQIVTTYEMQPVGKRTFRAAVHPESGLMKLRVSHPRLDTVERYIAAHRRGDASETFLMGDVAITPGASSPYGTLFFGVDQVAEAAGPTLSPVGIGYRVWPDNAPVDEPISISFPIPITVSDASSVHIYRKGGKRWEFQETEVRDGRLHISTRQFGTFAAMVDTEPPKIWGIEPREGAEVHSARPRIRAKISDVGSGIDAFSATVNGDWILMEYDPEQGLLSWEQDEDLGAGEAVLEIRASDSAGNVTVRQVEMTIASN